MKIFKNKVGRPSNETKNKRRIIICSIVVVVLLLIGSGIYFFKNGSNGLFTSVSKKSVFVYPVKNSKTYEFDKCVLDKYNSSYRSKKENYRSTLTEKELAKIKELDCSRDNIKQVNHDALNAMTKLKELDLAENYIEFIFIENTKLETINIRNNKIKKSSYIKITNNKKLKELYIGNFPFEEYQSELIVGGYAYYGGYNEIDSIDLSTNKNLVILWAKNAGLGYLDVSKNKKLESLDVSNASITNKYSLTVPNNALYSLDVTKNTKLKALAINGNKIYYINLSKNKKLERLYMQYTYISDINLSKNTKLYLLNTCSSNLKELDLSKNKKMKTLYTDLKSYKIKTGNNKKIDILRCS